MVQVTDGPMKPSHQHPVTTPLPEYRMHAVGVVMLLDESKEPTPAHRLGYNPCSTVGLLEPRTGRPTSKLLRLATTWICDDERSIIRHQCLPYFPLRRFIDKFLIVGDDALGDGLT